MDEQLERLAEILHQGQKLSGQGSYERRAPSNKAMPFLRQARRGLRDFVRQYPDNVEALRLLAQAEETLLDYASARMALEQAMDVSGVRDRQSLRKLALLKEYESQWGALGLTPEQLAELGKHLSDVLSSVSCEHTLQGTETWLRNISIPAPEKVMKALARRGAYCDCEVLYNLVQG